MKAELAHARHLGPSSRSEMLTLFRRHFDGVSHDDFVRDLAAKDYALLLYDDDSQLVGFTSFAHETLVHRGTTLGVVYSGDTVMSPAAWSSSMLMPAWVRAVREVHATRGVGPLWWLLLTSGYRTYRFLPVLFLHFWPRHGDPPPTAQRALMERLAKHRYGTDFEPGTGIVRFPRPQRLRGTLSGIPEARRRSPHISFFERANPGHADGDELVCLTDLSLANLTPAGERMWRRGEVLELQRRGPTEAQARNAAASDRIESERLLAGARLR